MKRMIIRKPITFILLIVTLFLFGCSSSKANGYDGFYGEAQPSYSTGETYQENTENDFIKTTEKQEVYVSLDRNTASYSLIRTKILQGDEIPTDLVRTEEMINYFNYNIETKEDACFNAKAEMGKAPWNEKNYLLTLGIKTKEIEINENIHNNLVFLIDVSGSMEDRIRLVKESLYLLVDKLTANDHISIVTYANGTKVVLENASGSQKVLIKDEIEKLTAGGGTNGQGGIQLAYSIGSQYFIEGGNNRVILATDGDFNIGISSSGKLKEFIKEKAQTGLYLTVLGFGQGNYRDDMGEALAQNGNGNYFYIDSIIEAKKALISEINGTLLTVAKDTKAKISFNKELVSEYRLIGYENKQMSEDEYLDQNKDAGEIGSGHVVYIVFELVLNSQIEDKTTNLFNYEITYKEPETSETKVENFSFNYEIVDQGKSDDYQFISCVVETALLLKESKYAGTANYAQIISLLESIPTIQEDQFRLEFLELVKILSNNQNN